MPFSLLGAIQNQSRDWVIAKIAVGVTYDSDLEKARKLIKQIGLDLQKDPEFAPLILEPLKMQGVEQLGDFAVQIRAKMMTLPGLSCAARTFYQWVVHGVDPEFFIVSSPRLTG